MAETLAVESLCGGGGFQCIAWSQPCQVRLFQYCSIWFTSTIIPQFSHAILVPQRCEKYEGPDPWKMSNLLRSFRLPHFYETSIPHKFQEVKIDSRKCRVGLAAIRDKPNV